MQMLARREPRPPSLLPLPSRERVGVRVEPTPMIRHSLTGASPSTKDFGVRGSRRATFQRNIEKGQVHTAFQHPSQDMG